MIPKPPAPTTREILSEIVMVNNRTDKVYRVTSENDFGLWWDYHEHIFKIHQYISSSDSKPKCRFMDFSMVSLHYKKINLE